jgi:hypothetical protein
VGRVSGVPSPHERLRALGATATIGTDRFAGDAAAADVLLTDAARFGIQARAGWRPRVHTTRLPACPPEDKPIANPAATATLLRLLADPDPEIIEEWAQLALSHGVRIDGPTAPLVLDWWARQPRRPVSIFAALGQHGEWLASLNQDWQKHVATAEIPTDADGVWQTGKGPERLAILTSVRRLDPARALALIESTWKSDPASDRQRFLEVLIANPSMADEPFLEAALDDRSKIVRRQAAAVLALIPGSRLRHRHSEAAKPMVTVRTARAGLVGRSRGEVVMVPPESFDASWERDGIEQRPPEGVGPRAWWMRQVLALADLAVWTDATGFGPDTILELLKNDDYAGDAVQALIAAAGARRDAAWSAALVRFLIDRADSLESIATLLEALPDDQRESLSLEILDRAPLTNVDRWTVLTSFDRPWSSTFSFEAMRILGRHAAEPIDDIWRLPRAIEIASRRISPDAAAVFEEAVIRMTTAEAARTSAERVRLRAEMHKEFTS